MSGEPLTNGEAKKNHLFISYATEQGYFVEWLCSKLIADGYSVWCDKLKLLGGESYPTDIDKALKERTFRVIAVLSRQSISKPNPRRERTLALKIADERNIDFLIPINFDGLAPSELDWMTSDITFISFNYGWAEGYKQLIKKLSSINTPRNKDIDMDQMMPWLDEKTVLLDGRETIFSNALKIEKIPERILIYKFENPISYSGVRTLVKNWPCYRINSHVALSFMSPPPEIVEKYMLERTGAVEWRTKETIRGIPTYNIIVNLLEKSISFKCWERGLIEQKRASFYFPYGGEKERNILHFVDYNGITTWRLASGQRKLKLKTEQTIYYRYHVCPTFRIRGSFDSGFYAIVNVLAHVTNEDGTPIKGRSQNSRSKKITKYWWNPQILNYQLAIIQHLSGRDDKIVIGQVPGEMISITPRFEQYELPLAIREKPGDQVEENDPIPIEDLEEESEDLEYEEVSGG